METLKLNLNPESLNQRIEILTQEIDSLNQSARLYASQGKTRLAQIEMNRANEMESHRDYLNLLLAEIQDHTESIGVLNLSMRAHNVLTRNGVDTVGKVIACRDGIPRLKHVGDATLAEIDAKLNIHLDQYAR